MLLFTVQIHVYTETDTIFQSSLLTISRITCTKQGWHVWSRDDMSERYHWKDWRV